MLFASRIRGGAAITALDNVELFRAACPGVEALSQVFGDREK